MKDTVQEAHSQKRKRITIASVIAIVSLGLILIGVGIINGWFTSSNLFQTTQEQEGAGALSDPGSTPAFSSPPEQDNASELVDATANAPSGTEETTGASGTSDSTHNTATPPEGAQSGGGSSHGSGSSVASGGTSNASGSGGTSTPTPAPSPTPQPKPEPQPEPPPPAPQTITVSVHVDSSRAKSYGYPSSLLSKSVTVPSGASVYDALRATGVSIGGSSSYVRSIGGLAEFQCGTGSGWLYYVNGSSPGYGCGSYLLYGGERITWIYTLDRGNDV